MIRFFRSRQREEEDDASLLARFQQSGDAADLSLLYGRYVELIYSQALYYLKEVTSAEDACMEIFEQLLKKLPSQEVHNFRPWLQTVVRNHCLMELRKNKRDPIAHSEDLFMHSATWPHLIAEDTEQQQQEERLAALEQCVAALPAEQKQCIQLFYLQEGYTYLRVAEELSIELGKVRSFIQNGRRNLRICLAHRYSNLLE